MLFKKTLPRRIIAAALMLLTLSNTIFPVATYALTSGPTAPEATSFEPIDTTDMVNLQTGDFTYNMPLLEVPGPEGGYPLSLSYHAGIQPNEDASWVGLGWTLNPGAITRNVNGYADDWNNPNSNSQVYWEGGTTKTYNVGVSIGIANVITVGAGLSFSQDTYKGFGVGGYASVGKTWDLGNTKIGASVGVGLSPYGGDPYAFGSVGIVAGSGISASLGVGFNTNFESFSAGVSGGIGYKTFPSKDGKNAFSGSILGASLNTGGGKPSLNVGGVSKSTSSTEANSVQVDHSSFSVDIPVYYFNVSLGYSKTRYWIDKSTNINLHGSLYSTSGSNFTETTEGSLTKMIPNNHAFDTYSLLENFGENNIMETPDPNKVQGGAYPEFDNYNVNAQGLGGAMRPYLFTGEVLGQNRKKENGDHLVTYYSPAASGNATPHFRFEGDFSNSYRQTYPDYDHPENNLRLVEPPFGTQTYGNGDGSYGFYNNKLAGSKHIDIGPAIKPDLSKVKGYVKADRYLTGMIEGFSITNESGVTYHYGLPAYSWGEEIYQEKISKSNGLFFNRSIKNTPYAYTWYLTTITGPDFVDRDNSGTANDGDWGYWVNFEYGKWSNSYYWRNPSEGFNRDEDNEFQNVTMGTKEVYYLNAISTRTHVAMFEKDIRNDGKSASPENFHKNIVGSTSTNYINNGIYNVNSSQSLKLSKIYLFNISDVSTVTTTSGSATAFEPLNPRSTACTKCELSENVIDKIDVDAVGRESVELKAVRIIDFTYDYSLCQNTVNSFDINNPSSLQGKLTLNAVTLRGRGGESLLPSTKFEYELSADNGLKTQANVNMTAEYFTTTNSSFEVGDYLNYAVYRYGVITGKEDLGGGNFKYMLANNHPFSGTTNVSTSKNPLYDKDRYDLWGHYKSDANLATIQEDENKGRLTSVASSKMADAWSLRKIILSTGGTVNIEYESKVYKSVLNNIVSLNAVIQNSSGNVAIYFPKQEDFSYAYSCFNINDNISFIALYRMLLGGSSKVMDTRKSFPNMKVTSKPLIGTTILTNTPYATFQDSLFLNTTFKLANVFCGKENLKVGGGIRVKQITSNDNTGSTYTTSYNYTDPLTGKETGVSTYDPNVFDVADFSSEITDLEKIRYKAALYKELSSLLVFSREIPPPGVMHEYVRVTSSVKNSSESVTRTVAGGVQYQFEVFRENMILKNNTVTPFEHQVTSWGTMDSRNLVIKKFLHGIGNIKRIIQYDKDGKKVGETINHYLHDGLEDLSADSFFDQYYSRLAQFNYQGVLQERYSESKAVNEIGWNNSSQVKATLSAREYYPNIATGQTVINYVNGTQTTSQNLAFDFYSGALTKSVETDTYGNRIMTETMPAYRKYASLGLKVGTASNKNMLTQTAAAYMYKVDASNNKLGVVSANVDTWSNAVFSLDTDGTQYTQNGSTKGDVWRPQYSYAWMPVNRTTDNLTAIGSFVDFNFTTPSSSNANWNKTSEATLYDVYSKALEASDMNGNYIATRMNDLSKKIELNGGPAKYYEIAYSGAEDGNINRTVNGFVKKVDGTVVSTAGVAHTGSKSLKLGVSGKKGFVYTIECNKLTPGRDYMASVWVKPVSGSASDVKLYYDKGGAVLSNSISSGSSTKSAGSWKLINIKINGSDVTAGATINIGCRNDHASAEAYADDFRFQPMNAGTTAYVYDATTGELTHMLDNSNLYVRFQYDAAGRLVATYKEKLGAGEYKTNEYQQNFGATKYTPSFSTYSATRNDCPAGHSTTSITVPIPAGMFVSYISVADANRQAIDYAQAEANRLGVCTSPGNIQLRNNIAADAPSYTDALLNQVEFLQGGVAMYTYTWPTGPGSREASSFVSVAPGSYNLRFKMLVGEPETSRYFGFRQAPSGSITKWTRGASNPTYTTSTTITVSSGTSYILTVASSSSLNN